MVQARWWFSSRQKTQLGYLNSTIRFWVWNLEEQTATQTETLLYLLCNSHELRPLIGHSGPSTKHAVGSEIKELEEQVKQILSEKYSSDWIPEGKVRSECQIL